MGGLAVECTTHGVGGAEATRPRRCVGCPAPTSMRPGGVPSCQRAGLESCCCSGSICVGGGGCGQDGSCGSWAWSPRLTASASASSSAPCAAAAAWSSGGCAREGDETTLAARRRRLCSGVDSSSWSSLSRCYGCTGSCGTNSLCDHGHCPQHRVATAAFSLATATTSRLLLVVLPAFLDLSHTRLTIDTNSITACKRHATCATLLPTCISLPSRACCYRRMLVDASPESLIPHPASASLAAVLLHPALPPSPLLLLLSPSSPPCRTAAVRSCPRR